MHSGIIRALSLLSVVSGAGLLGQPAVAERFVSDEQTIAIQMYTHFEVRADDPDSPFGQIRAGETFEFRGLIMYRLRADGKFADIKVAYNSFIYTSLDGIATDLGIPH